MAETSTQVEVSKSTPATAAGHPLSSLRERWNTLFDDLLTVRGEKHAEREKKGKGYHLTERSYGSFTRSFRLPPDADAGKASASFSKGVLSISVPKSAEAHSKVKKIDVTAS